MQEYHKRAREAFLYWRSCGSPRTGVAADHMRTTRARFKLAFKECRASEAKLRAEAQAEKLLNRDMSSFWADVRKINPRTVKVSNCLDDARGEEEILNLWRNKYKQLFNSVDPLNMHNELLSKVD